MQQDTTAGTGYGAGVLPHLKSLPLFQSKLFLQSKKEGP